MLFEINTLDDLDLRGKTVLCRIDINQPVNRATGELKSTARIAACIPTVRELADRGAKVVLLAHQGSDIEYKNFHSLYPHSKVLASLLRREVMFIEDICGPTALDMIRHLNGGEILLLDNVRFLSEEQTLFETKLRLTHEEQADTLLVRKLAPLADLYVCDAFAAAHRSQPSLCGFEQVLPSAMGRLFEKEFCVISQLMASPKRPCVFILGGAKIADAFEMMNSVLAAGRAEYILTGGLTANILLAAKGENIGSGSLNYIMKSNYGKYISIAAELYRKYPKHIVLPQDLAWTKDGKRREAALGHIPADAVVTDIGSDTARLYADIIMASETVFANGPMGIFEESETELGTRTVWQALAATAANTIIGGGDSIAAVNKYGIASKLSYICTGGGAMIRFLSGEELPVVKALRLAAKREHK